MKKIITFVCCTILFTCAFSQSGRGDNDRQYNRNNNIVYRDNNFSVAERNREIQRVSSRYDYRIEQVSCNRSLSHRERKFTIRALRIEKAERINNIYARYAGNNAYNNRRTRSNRDHDYDQRNHNND